MKVLICGAGIAGLTLAWWLRRGGAEVTIVERAPGPRSDGYMIDFFGSGYDVAERMGVLGDLREIAADISELAYTDPRGRRTGGVRYASAAAILGGRVLSLMRGGLESVLRSSLDPGVEVRYGTSVAAVRDVPGGVEAELTDGTVSRADLLAGADGIHSVVRRLVFGPEEHYLRPLGYHTASYLLRDAGLAERTGGRAVLVSVPDRQAGIYPTRDGALAAFLVHACTDTALPADPRSEITTRYRGMGALTDRILAHCPPDPYYDCVAQIRMPRWSRGRTVLIGDAAHAVSLMAGQGASMAMGGAYTLAVELLGADAGAALERYERRMRPFVLGKQDSGRTAAEWMVPHQAWRIAVRNRLAGLAGLPGGRAVMGRAFRRLSESVIPAA
ncbi:FAD-dependent oxidoreductase [Planomonospora venezuelensis]|uniref:2-polyprenyl-6-methoxyphenol hydroxylase-like FAD-dependent oxidoreductase n=1 Tax=Planomonospora venezuelensis TaxID=1999 RepID=A0A841CW38_PLAVE|nr:FAD-dependent oxidoreductase [Planomonospora venezuelensis]MBB5962602.1 2-polyprenyl-6-methoxyphenol hydroxylase-like FAD-dependent oxidoreductase [Planomonospora venezuelensis]GIM98351.1 FAD-dependent oxidoreductase [Planomonospora venezuelensis]